MRRSLMLCVLTLVPVLAMLGLQTPSQAQGLQDRRISADGSAIAQRI